MLVKGGTKCIKYLLFAFNFTFWLTGIAVFAIGLWLRFDSQTKSIFEHEENYSSYYTVVYILIGASALMMLADFLGCSGAMQQLQSMLGLFFAILLVIFAIEITAAIWDYSHKEEVIWDIKEFYRETYKIKTKEGPLQGNPQNHALDCCGLTAVLDQLITDTCPTKGLVSTVTIKPCLEAIEEVFNNKFHIIGAVGIGIAVVMIFGMIFSMILCCAILRK